MSIIKRSFEIFCATIVMLVSLFFGSTDFIGEVFMINCDVLVKTVQAVLNM